MFTHLHESVVNSFIRSYTYKMIVRACLIILISLVFYQGLAQSIPVGLKPFEEAFRQLQLLNKNQSRHSFSIRPIIPPSIPNFEMVDSLFYQNLDSINEGGKKSFFEAKAMPIVFNSQFNSSRPFGWNNAGMRMARGIQFSGSAGFFLKAGPVTAQFMPEWYYTENRGYDTTRYFNYKNLRPIKQAYLGQSSIRLNIGPFSAGISSENLWWGPGQFSSIIMSNNAPGFHHLTFNTRRPLKTFLGNFEWQLIVGELNEDSSLHFENFVPRRSILREFSRYYNAVVITYEPKWAKNFFIGFTRFEQLYSSVQRTRPGTWMKRFLPVLTFETADENASGVIRNDGGVSLFGRWVMPKQHAEFYFEFGYNDFKQNLRDLTVNANHASAFLVGFKKLFLLNSHSFIDLSGELLHMAENPSNIIRISENWYEHFSVRQGYTHQNQIMGAGSGPGNNVQTIAIKKVNGLNHIGFKIQRIQQDPKGFIAGAPLGMRELRWTDWDFGFSLQKKWKRFLLQTDAHIIFSKNYGWSNANKSNFFHQIQAIYYFK